MAREAVALSPVTNMIGVAGKPSVFCGLGRDELKFRIKVGRFSGHEEFVA